MFFDSTFKLWDTRIDAANNYWGFNTTLAVRGRIRDQSDDYRLLEVINEPYYMNNRSILNGKCPPGWDLVGETCYMYIGAPMTFWEARAFCQVRITKGYSASFRMTVRILTIIVKITFSFKLFNVLWKVLTLIQTLSIVLLVFFFVRVNHKIVHV